MTILPQSCSQIIFQKWSSESETGATAKNGNKNAQLWTQTANQLTPPLLIEYTSNADYKLIILR